MIFHHRAGVWDLTGRARVVGILNLTPDSFFDAQDLAARAGALAADVDGVRALGDHGVRARKRGVRRDMVPAVKE